MGFAEDFNARMSDNMRRYDLASVEGLPDPMHAPGIVSTFARDQARARDLVEMVASGILTLEDAKGLMPPVPTMFKLPDIAVAEEDPKTGVMRCPGCKVEVGVGEVHGCDRLSEPHVMQLPPPAALQTCARCAVKLMPGSMRIHACLPPSLPVAPAPRRPIYETTCDFETWTPHEAGRTMDGVRALRKDGVLTMVRCANRGLVEASHYDFARWLAIAKLEAEDNTPLRPLPGPDWMNPTRAMGDPRECNSGIKALNLPPAREPFVSSVGEWDLLPWA